MNISNITKYPMIITMVVLFVVGCLLHIFPFTCGVVFGGIGLDLLRKFRTKVGF